MLVRADHPNNINRGRVCIYYKEFQPFRVINLPYLQEALLLELNDQNKKIIISNLYRCPSQNSEEFENLLTNFEHLLSFFFLILKIFFSSSINLTIQYKVCNTL